MGWHDDDVDGGVSGWGGGRGAGLHCNIDQRIHSSLWVENEYGPGYGWRGWIGHHHK